MISMWLELPCRRKLEGGSVRQGCGIWRSMNDVVAESSSPASTMVGTPLHARGAAVAEGVSSGVLVERLGRSLTESRRFSRERAKVALNCCGYDSFISNEEHLENTVAEPGDDERFDVHLPVSTAMDDSDATHVAHMRGNRASFVEVLAGFVATRSELSERFDHPSEMWIGSGSRSTVSDPRTLSPSMCSELYGRRALLLATCRSAQGPNNRVRTEAPTRTTPVHRMQVAGGARQPAL